MREYLELKNVSTSKRMTEGLTCYSLLDFKVRFLRFVDYFDSKLDSELVVSAVEVSKMTGVRPGLQV